MKKQTPVKKAGLNDRQKRFAKEYITDFNATQAAVRSGFSPDTAGSQASRLLKNVHVRACIDKMIKEREERLEASADFVVRELMRIAKFDIREIFDDKGALKDMKDIPEDTARAIAGVDIDELFEGRGDDRKHIGYTKKIKAWDKVRALEALGEHFGLFKKPQDPKEGEKQRKGDLLQVIKILSKDGQTTVIENRIGEGQGEAAGMDQSGPGRIRIL